MEYVNWFLDFSNRIYDDPTILLVFVGGALILGLIVRVLFHTLFSKTVGTIVGIAVLAMVVFAVGGDYTSEDILGLGNQGEIGNEQEMATLDELPSIFTLQDSYTEPHLAEATVLRAGPDPSPPRLQTQSLEEGIAIIREQYAAQAAREAAYVYVEQANGKRAWYGPQVGGSTQLRAGEVILEAFESTDDTAVNTFVVIHNHPSYYVINSAPPSMQDGVAFVQISIAIGRYANHIDPDGLSFVVLDQGRTWKMEYRKGWLVDNTLYRLASGKLSATSNEAQRLQSALEQALGSAVTLQDDYICGISGYQNCEPRTQAKIRQANQAVDKLVDLFKTIGIKVTRQNTAL